MQKALDAIEKIYNKGVKESDKKGFADKFKSAMKTFEKALKKDIKATFKDVKYLDGYFIFGTGTNSVVHFKLKETPDWLYGIWWDIPKKYYDKEKKKMAKEKVVATIITPSISITKTIYHFWRGLGLSVAMSGLCVGFLLFVAKNLYLKNIIKARLILFHFMQAVVKIQKSVLEQLKMLASCTKRDYLKSGIMI